MENIIQLEENKSKLDELNSFINLQPDKKDALITILHKAQKLFGYLPHELQLYVARKLDIPAAKVYGVVSFYSFFSQNKKGTYTISVCTGTACFVKGAETVMKEFKNKLSIDVNSTTADNMFTLKDIRCIGACGLAPVVMVNDKVYGHVTKEKVSEILDEYSKKEVQ